MNGSLNETQNLEDEIVLKRLRLSDSKFIKLLDPKTFKKFDQYKILDNDENLLLTSLGTLRRHNIDKSLVNEIKQSAKNPEEGFIRCSDISNETHPELFERLSFGIQSLDNVTDGGLDFSAITEIYGESSSGKTQICLQLALNIQKQFNRQCVYISCCKNFPAGRVHRMSKNLSTRHLKKKINFLDNILVYEFRLAHKLLNSQTSYSTILDTLVSDHLEKDILSDGNVKLLIIDSIADFYRHECNNYVQRANEMRTTVEKIRQLALKYNLAVVCTNEVTGINTFFHDFEPALGATWRSLIDTRLNVSKTRENVKKLKVVHSSRLPEKSAEFIITANGIEDHTEMYE